MFSRKVQNQTDKIDAYLELISLRKLTNEQALSCQGIISEYEVFKSLKSKENNKSPGNDELFKEFNECFWNEIKNPFVASIHRAFLNQELCSFKKQAVIKMLEKKDKTKRFIKNWRSISLLNTNMKIISKVLLTGISFFLPFLISSSQTAYFKNRFISRKVISDILEISNLLVLKGFLVTVDIEKAFDSLNHCFLSQII